MLKSTFKKVSAIAIAGTMLAGMMAVPANAMTTQTVYDVETINVINENFDNYNPSSQNIQTTYSDFDQNSNIQFKRSVYWKGELAFAIENDTDLKSNVLKASFADGLAVNFKNPSTTTQINEGDIVEISYKFKYNDSNAKMLLNLNNANTRFTYISSSNTGGTTSNANWADTKEGRILSMYMNQGWMAVSDTKQSNATISKDTWNTVTVTINTKDADHDNRQTLTAKSGTWNLVGYFDANYTGSDDTTYDLLSSISSLQFDTYSWYSNNNPADFYIDDLKVDVKKNVARDVLVSDLSKTVLNETFDNFVKDHSQTSAYSSVDGTAFQWKTLWGNTATLTPGTMDGKALTFGPTTEKVYRIMKADLGNVSLATTDEIHVSYDRQFGAQGTDEFISGINLTDTNFDTSWDDGNVGITVSQIGGTATGTRPIDFLSNGQIQVGGINDSGGVVLTENTRYHVEYIIKISDPEHDNRQTVTYTVTGPDDSLYYNWDSNQKFNSWSKTYYIDANNADGNKDTKYTSLTSFNMRKNGTNATTLDNIKVEIVKPGFEVDGVANTGNTYSFRGNGAIDLNYLVDASANSKVIVAQYADGGRMISATTEDVAATGRDTVTVTPDPTAKTIKVMVIDMNNALPYTKAFVMTRSN